MSNGREFQRTEAATGNERRPTVDRRKDGTRSDCEDDDRSRRRPGRSATSERQVSGHSVVIQCMVLANELILAQLVRQPGRKVFSKVMIVTSLTLV